MNHNAGSGLVSPVSDMSHYGQPETITQASEPQSLTQAQLQETRPLALQISTRSERTVRDLCPRIINFQERNVIMYGPFSQFLHSQLFSPNLLDKRRTVYLQFLILLILVPMPPLIPIPWGFMKEITRTRLPRCVSAAGPEIDSIGLAGLGESEVPRTVSGCTEVARGSQPGPCGRGGPVLVRCTTSEPACQPV